MSEHTPFLTIFPGCADMAGSAGGLDRAYVTDVRVDTAEMSMSICAWFASMPSPVDISSISARLRSDYGLSSVGIVPDYPRLQRASSPAVRVSAPSGGRPQGDVLMGRAIKQHPVPMNTLTL